MPTIDRVLEEHVAELEEEIAQLRSVLGALATLANKGAERRESGRG